MTRALLVHPEFRWPSFWNFPETCKLSDARYPTAPLGLCTVAGLLPSDWETTLVDRNVEDWDESFLDSTDIVLIGAMMPQQLDCLEMVRKAHARGKLVIVGGPDPTSSPHIYDEADHLVLGEAEVSLPQFLADFAAGNPTKIYRDSRRADVQASPTPRFDLLKFGRYNHVGIQFCRGCPFSCEFCDIIELFGRVPRAKTSTQMLTELQTLYDLGYRGHVSLVDDNFIGNKKLVKQFLPELKQWQQKRDFPFEFTTEASINLADDPDLMNAMQEVGFFAVFVGIESPDEATLVGMQKRQNTHRSIADSIRKIYAHGMFVISGFIIGFDHEKGDVAGGIIDCIEAAAIPVNMVGLLFALPNTQLMRRLAAEGRLHENYDVALDGFGDQCTGGLNYDTLRPRVDILRDYLRVVQTIYTPERYFNRVREVGLQLNCSTRRFKPAGKQLLREMKAFWRILSRLGLSKTIRPHFLRTLLQVALKNPNSLRYTGLMMGMYLDVDPFSAYVAASLQTAIASQGKNRSKATLPSPEIQSQLIQLRRTEMAG